VVTRYIIWLAGDSWIPAVREVVGQEALPSGCTPESLVRRGLLFGDMGMSTQTDAPVAPYLMRRLNNSLVLAGIAFAATMPISLLFGVIAGLKEGSFLDRFISLISLVTTSTPSFALGVVLVVIFSLWLRVLPGISALLTESSAFENPAKLVMPVMVLFFAEAGYVARMTRASMVDVMRQPYVRTAILKGMPRHIVIFKHALRNALLAPVTVIMLHISWLIGGVVVVEMMFGFPGLGSALLEASLNKDLNVIEAGALLMTFVATATQLIADIIYVYLNPRIRYT
jgi:peptide/nickel transport system permease protein